MGVFVSGSDKAWNTIEEFGSLLCGSSG